MLSALRSGLRTARVPVTRAFSANSCEFDLPAYETHGIASELPLPTTATATKEELEGYLRQMLAVRRMEIALDSAYRERLVRGFLHLGDGQEAICMGVEAGLTREDSWITSYRCHGVAVMRGVPVVEVLAELMGFQEGNVRGKGGSMHLYSKKGNFYGGAGIVGAQVPIGAGLAFANAYKAKQSGSDTMNVAIAAYGDGAANQGQIWEAANMSALWNLPTIFMIENNQYGMGTSMERSSSNFEYYTMGANIPGIRVNGMDVLAVREAIRVAKEYCGSGKGPMYMEMMTYRYHGHSMSDPGTSYRDRSEIQEVRARRDPIEAVKARMEQAGFATADELKAIEKEVRKDVNSALKEARGGTPPPLSECYTDIFSDGKGGSEIPPFIRLPDFTKSRVNGEPMTQ